jgi:alpha-L-rhamnosidase
MFGSVTEWYYRWLGGIRPDPAYPGFREFILAPSVPSGLDAVQCAYQSPFGEIVSNWKKLDGGTVRYEMAIPEGSNARVSLSLEPHQRIAMIQKQETREPVHMEDLQSGNFILGAGKYIIKVSPDPDQI